MGSVVLTRFMPVSPPMISALPPKFLDMHGLQGLRPRAPDLGFFERPQDRRQKSGRRGGKGRCLALIVLSAALTREAMLRLHHLRQQTLALALMRTQKDGFARGFGRPNVAIRRRTCRCYLSMRVRSSRCWSDSISSHSPTPRRLADPLHPCAAVSGCGSAFAVCGASVSWMHLGQGGEASTWH